ncbi:hypothetical protein NO135_23045, partial [Clostridioides difficile]|nr:hypothetical protein [Clostridioides difficile]
EIFDRGTTAAADEEELTQRLQALDTDEYRHLVQVAQAAEATLGNVRKQLLAAAEAVGAAETACQQKREDTKTKQSRAVTQQG